MSQIPHDRLDAEERRLADLLAQAPAGEPSAALDARILAIAYAAPAARRRTPRWGWGWGASAAALLALGVFVPVLKQEHQREQSAVEWQTPAPASKPVAQPGAEMSNERADAALSEAKRDVSAPDAGAAPGGAPAEPFPAKAEADSMLAPTPQRRAEAAVDARERSSKPALNDAPRPAAPTAAVTPMAVPLPAAAPPAAADSVRQEAVEQPASVPEAAPPLPAEDDQSVRKQQTTTMPASPPVSSGLAAPTPAPAPVVGAAADRAPAASTGAARSGPPEPADAWLQRIERLRADGDLPSARAELRRFIAAHPQHPLPAALQALRDAD